MSNCKPTSTQRVETDAACLPLDTPSQDVLGLVLEATNTGLWTWEVESDLVRWSPETYGIHGLKPGEFGGTGAAFFELAHPDDRVRVRDAVYSAVREHRLYAEEFRVRRPDGSIRWVMNRARARYDSRGAPRSVLGTITDITDRVMTADALRHGSGQVAAWLSDQRFRALADTAPALLWVTDEQHRCTFLSRGWQEYTGLDEAQGLGDGWLEPVHPEDREAALSAFLAAAAREAPFSVDYRLRRADGEYRWTIDTGRPRTGLRGEFVGYAGSVIDVHERKLAEDELRRQTALIEGISTGTQDLIAAQDEHYRYVYFNDAYRRTFESLWGRELRIGTSMLEALAEWPEELAKAQRLWSRAHAGETFSVTMRFGPPGRPQRSFDLRFNPVFDAAGRRLGAAHILRDVTALEASEARLRRIIDSMFAFVGMLEPDGTLVEVNQAPLEIAGLARADVIGRPFWDVIWWAYDPRVRERMIASFARAVRGESVRYEEQIWTVDDGRLTVDLLLQPVFEAGHLVCVIPSAVDVTARTRVEATLAQREAAFNEDTRRAFDALARTADLLRAATDAANLGIHMYDVASGSIEWDARVRAVWGVPPDAPIDYRTFMDGIHPADRADVQRRVDAALDPDGDGRYEAEYRVRNRSTGVERWVYATGRVTFVDRAPTRMVGTVQDITAQKEAEARLRRADRQKDVFLATLAHELRNPLAPIRTAARLLTSPGLAPDKLAWAQGVIQRQARNMGLLLDDLLDVSRITQGKLTLKRERVDLALALDAAVETAAPLIERKQHRLEVAMPQEAVTLDADPLRLSQIFSNLLTNAAKYTDPNGHIQVLIRIDGSNVVVEVSDDGIGMAPETLPKLFETFAQVDTAHARAEGGLGIGLALVKGLVELHGGSIEARSEGEGRGSTFVVYLPLDRPPETRPA